MEHVATLFGPPIAARRKIASARETERGMLMKYFLSRLNPPRIAAGIKPVSYPRMGKILEGIPTKDLYYLKRVCDDAPHWSKKFWWLLDPKKHPDAQAIDVRAIN